MCKRRRVEQELVGATRVAEGGGRAVRPPRAHGRATEDVIPAPPSPTGRLCALGWGRRGGATPNQHR